MLFVPLPITSSGKTQKECLDEKCSPRLFYISSHRGKDHQSIISTESKKRSQPIIACPYCGITGNSKKFISRKDKQYIFQTAIEAFYEDMKDNFYNFFKNPKNSEKIDKIFTADYIQSLYSQTGSSPKNGQLVGTTQKTPEKIIIGSSNESTFQDSFGVNSNEFRSIFCVNILNTAWLIHNKC